MSVSVRGTSSTNAMPAGMIMAYAATTPPQGWVTCDGAALSRTTYAALFSIIGTSYGVGDGSTTFNAPDLRGRAPIGFGAGAGLTARTTLNAPTGAETVTLTALQSGAASHGHTTSGWGGGTHTASGGIAVDDHSHAYVVMADGTNSHDHAINSGTISYPAAQSDGGASSYKTLHTQGSAPGGSASVTVANHGHSVTIDANGAAGAAAAHNNMQPSAVVNFIIKY
jgi:microcystin-dependent protein